MKRGALPSWQVAALGLGALLCALGCTNPLGLGPEQCDRSLEGNSPLVYKEGQASEGVYETSPWGGEWLFFPGGMHYALEHRLGVTPTWVQPYLSFNEQGLGSGVSVDTGEGGTSAGSDVATDAPPGLVTPASGDAVSLIGIDDRYIVVANMSCASYYLRVVAGTGGVP